MKEAARVIKESGLSVSSLCRGGFFTADDSYNLDDNFRAVDEAVVIGAESLIIVAGGLAEKSKDLSDARKRIAEGLSRLLEYSKKHELPIAIEPLHPMYAADRCCINTLKQAIEICENLGEGIGVVVDVYHTWWDPDLKEQIERAGEKGLILGFHICDWLVPTEDMLTDRGMMGDGIIDIPQIWKWVKEAGYKGFCEVEIFSEKNWWQRNPDEVLRICKQRHSLYR